MSAATTSSTEIPLVYVRLLGEGTVVFRPTAATSIGPDTVRLLTPNGYDPEDEDWEFKPGAVVRIELTNPKGCRGVRRRLRSRVAGVSHNLRLSRSTHFVAGAQAA